MRLRRTKRTDNSAAANSTRRSRRAPITTNTIVTVPVEPALAPSSIALVGPADTTEVVDSINDVAVLDHSSVVNVDDESVGDDDDDEGPVLVDVVAGDDVSVDRDAKLVEVTDEVDEAVVVVVITLDMLALTAVVPSKLAHSTCPLFASGQRHW